MTLWHHLPRPVVGLAPMDGVTDIAFRHIIAAHGRPDVVFTEFTNVIDVSHGREMGWEPLRFTDCQRPIVAQLYGKHPEFFYKAAHVVSELGFDGLDINMGCPSKNVASSGSGAGLIKTPELALEIMAATKRGLRDWADGQTLAEAGLKPGIVERTRRFCDARAVLNGGWHGHDGGGGDATLSSRHDNGGGARRALPLSVKTRLGYDSVIIREWSACLAQGRPEVISIHGRTLKQMYRGDADWDAIAEAAVEIHRRGILVFGNGDVNSLNDAVARIRASGVDGVLLGRAALGNPWIFHGKALMREAVHGRTPHPALEPSVSTEDRFDMMLTHARAFEQFHDARRFPRMRKHLGWYCHGFPHAAALRAGMVITHHAGDVARLLDAYRADHAPSAAASRTPLAAQAT